MEQFSLEKYLENPSRKITTRFGNRKVRIICTNRKAKLPIVALMVDMDGNEYVTYHTKNGWCSEEEKYLDKRDLFFADEEEELNEFENTMVEFAHKMFDHLLDTTKEIDIKEWKGKLLDLARKELQPEFDKKLKEAYNQGGLDTQEEITKSLPRWKKMPNGIQGNDDFNPTYLVRVSNGYHFTTPCLSWDKDSMYVELSELDKLPKEE